jgi:uncharacterized protein (TIGR03435 family)
LGHHRLKEVMKFSGMLLTFSCVPVVAFAQGSPTTPAFEVASIKLYVQTPSSPPKNQYYMASTIDGSRAEFDHGSLADLIRTAYRINPNQISGPDWIKEDRFDIIAKMADGASKDHVPEMLKALLAERFKLVAHIGKKDQIVYAMAPAKGGPKLKPTSAGADYPPGGKFMRTVNPDGSMQMDVQGMTTNELAGLIGRFVNRTVVDQTELKGKYDVVLTFSPEDIRVASNAAGTATPSGAEGDSSTSLPYSLQRVGLKLESRKLPDDVLVIDHLEKVPTEN